MDDPEVVEIPAKKDWSDAERAERQILITETKAQSVFASRIQGTRREAKEDDSGIAFGEGLAEKFGEAIPMPSAPPMSDEIRRQQQEWARATQVARVNYPKHDEYAAFYRKSGLDGDRRTKEPVISQAELPVDEETSTFLKKISAARLAYASMAAEPEIISKSPLESPGRGSKADVAGVEFPKISDDPAVSSLILGVPPSKDFASFGEIYLPPILLAERDLETDQAIAALKSDDQFDEVQLLANEAARVYKSSWVWGKKVAGGTLEIRMNAERNKLIILGEGYKALNLGGVEGWATVAVQIPKDTDYFHVPAEFTIVRINPGHIGIAQTTGRTRTINRLLPGRYVLPERFVRFIGVAKIVPNTAVQFTPHHGSTDPDIGQLARRYTSYYLQDGYRLFASDRDGTFVLSADAQRRPFIFDSKGMEEPLNVTNPRDFIQTASNGRYHIVRLQTGQRIIIRGPSGNDVVVEAEDLLAANNTYHLSKQFFDFDGVVYDRTAKIVEAPKGNVTSIRMTRNEVLVMQDPDGMIRFMQDFNPSVGIVLRPPWRAIAAVPVMQNEYVYEHDDLRVARVKPSANQWPIVHDVKAGEVKLFPHSIEYIFTSAEEQVYVGMADRTKKDPQTFFVAGYGTVTVAVVNSGQLAMCRLQNVSFFLPPLPEPYVFRPPNEFFGMVEMSSTHVNIPGSDLHRIYVPAGKWAVAMVDGRQIILDPASSTRVENAESGTEQGNGIWIFRAQQLALEGPAPIDAKMTELFNVVRLQIPMNEIGFGVDSRTGERLIWTSGNHTVNKNDGTIFQGFFSTQLEDVKIEKFAVVWKGGVKSTVDASVGFHIMSDTEDGKARGEVMRRVLSLCQHHEDLHDKVVENTKHQLFDVISQIEPLGYGSLQFDLENDTDVKLQPGGTKRRKETTLQDLEAMFSEHVHTILKKYGLVVDNVTIVKIELDEAFVQRSEEVQKARMEARKKVLVAEQELQRNQILQQQALSDQQARTRAEEELSKQRDIQRQREVDDEVARQRVAYEVDLKRQIALCESKVKQEELRILELEQRGKAAQVEMDTRKKIALLEAETKAVEKSAEAKAEAQARLQIAETLLEATKFEVQAQKLKAEGDRASGLAKTAVELNQAFGGLESDPALLLELLKMRSAVDGQTRIAEATARCTDPEIVRMMGRVAAYEEIMPALTQSNMGSNMGLAGYGYGIPTPHSRRFGSINPNVDVEVTAAATGGLSSVARTAPVAKTDGSKW